MFQTQVDHAIQQVRSLISTQRATGTISDRTIDAHNDVPFSRLTSKEIVDAARDHLRVHAPFSLDKATEILGAYPSMLKIKEPSSHQPLESSLSHALTTTLLALRAGDISDLALDQYRDMTLSDVIETFERTVALWKKLPVQTMFRENDPNTTILEFFGEHFRRGDAKEVDLRKIGLPNEKGAIKFTIESVDRWVQLLSTRTPEARAMARELKEARQFLVYVHDGLINLDDVRPAPAALTP
jgi:antitoxin component of RelBE/YafQ-DinJ toxin-antitoxin module